MEMKGVIKVARLIVITVLLVILAGCGITTDIGRMEQGMHPHRVVIYSGGKEIKTYHTTSKVESESGSDGWYFVDKETGKVVQCTGTMTIEEE